MKKLDKNKRAIDDFRQPVPEEEQPDDPWTVEEKIESARRIMRRLGIDADLSDPFEGMKDEHLQKLQ